jgi:hypothetical protein
MMTMISLRAHPLYPSLLALKESYAIERKKLERVRTTDTFVRAADAFNYRRTCINHCVAHTKPYILLLAPLLL